MKKSSKTTTIILIITILIILSLIFYLQTNKETNNSSNNNTQGKKISCPPNSRGGQFCIESYEPVCGFFNPEKIQCIKYPCAQTYSNSCFACQDEKVDYYTNDECPK